MINNKFNYKTILKKVSKFLLIFTAYSVVYLPIIIIFLLSINESKSGQNFTGLSFKWYLEIFQNERLLKAIMNTLLVALISTFVATISGTLIAIGINSLSKKRRIEMMILNNVPVVSPDIVTGISLMVVFSLLPLSFGLEFLSSDIDVNEKQHPS